MLLKPPTNGNNKKIYKPTIKNNNMKILHFTSEESWKSIQNSGFLLPKTNPNNFRLNLSEKLKKMMPFKEYLVGIPMGSYQGWSECKLTERLEKYTSGEVPLLLQITWEKGPFIRDHALYSPGRLENEKGIDMAKFQEKLTNDGYYLTNECKHIEKIIEDSEKIFKNDYLNSTMPLTNYSGQYLAPEVWLPQVTPLDSIKRIPLERLI